MPYIGRGPQQSGAFRILDDISLTSHSSGGFNGTRTTFALTVGNAALTVGLPETLTIAIDGVVQEPGTAYTISGSNIVFAAAPQTEATFWGVELGDVGGLADRATTQAANDNTTKVATTAYVQTELGDYATLAAPALTGNATAVTQSASNNSTRIATTAYVDAQVATEDTIAELNDTTITSIASGEVLKWNGSAWVNNTLAELGVLPVANPTFTGTLTVGSAAVTEAQLEILDGATVTTAELNLLDALARGSILYGNASGATALLGKGGNGQVLTSNNTDILWADAAGGGGVDTTGTPASNHIAIFHDSDTLKSTANFTFDNWPVSKRAGGTGESFAIEGYNTANYHTALVLRKSQNNTIDGMTVVDGDQTVGEISFQGASGTSAGNWGTGAAIRVNTDATVGNAWSGNNCPAIMRFYTCPSGGSEPETRMIIRSNGQVGIGAHNHGPSTFGTLHVKTASSGTTGRYSGGDDFIVEGSGDTGMTISAPNASTNFFCLATPSGGTQTSGFYMSYNSGSEYFAIMNAGGEKWKVTDGGVVSGQHGTYHQSSDVRIKENVKAITYGLDAVMAMRPVSYEFCDWYDADLANQTRLGFIAQEVKAIAPETINVATTPVVFEYKADDDTDVVETHETIEDMHSIEDQQLLPILVKAIQELNAKIDALGS